MKNDSENKVVRERVCHLLGYILLECRHVGPELLISHMDNIVKVNFTKLLSHVKIDSNTNINNIYF